MARLVTLSTGSRVLSPFLSWLLWQKRVFERDSWCQWGKVLMLLSLHGAGVVNGFEISDRCSLLVAPDQEVPHEVVHLVESVVGLCQEPVLDIGNNMLRDESHERTLENFVGYPDTPKTSGTRTEVGVEPLVHPKSLLYLPFHVTKLIQKV